MSDKVHKVQIAFTENNVVLTRLPQKDGGVQIQLSTHVMLAKKEPLVIEVDAKNFAAYVSSSDLNGRNYQSVRWVIVQGSQEILCTSYNNTKDLQNQTRLPFAVVADSSDSWKDISFTLGLELNSGYFGGLKKILKDFKLMKKGKDIPEVFTWSSRKNARGNKEFTFVLRDDDRMGTSHMDYVPAFIKFASIENISLPYTIVETLCAALSDIKLSQLTLLVNENYIEIQYEKSVITKSRHKDAARSLFHGSLILQLANATEPEKEEADVNMTQPQEVVEEAPVEIVHEAPIPVIVPPLPVEEEKEQEKAKKERPKLSEEERKKVEEVSFAWNAVLFSQRAKNFYSNVRATVFYDETNHVFSVLFGTGLGAPVLVFKNVVSVVMPKTHVEINNYHLSSILVKIVERNYKVVISLEAGDEIALNGVVATRKAKVENKFVTFEPLSIAFKYNLDADSNPVYELSRFESYLNNEADASLTAAPREKEEVKMMDEVDNLVSRVERTSAEESLLRKAGYTYVSFLGYGDQAEVYKVTKDGVEYALKLFSRKNRNQAQIEKDAYDYINKNPTLQEICITASESVIYDSNMVLQFSQFFGTDVLNGINEEQRVVVRIKPNRLVGGYLVLQLINGDMGFNQPRKRNDVSVFFNNQIDPDDFDAFRERAREVCKNTLFCHGDLHLRNIFYIQDAAGDVTFKLGDFGASSYLKENLLKKINDEWNALENNEIRHFWKRLHNMNDLLDDMSRATAITNPAVFYDREEGRLAISFDAVDANKIDEHHEYLIYNISGKSGIESFKNAPDTPIAFQPDFKTKREPGTKAYVLTYYDQNNPKVQRSFPIILHPGKNAKNPALCSYVYLPNYVNMEYEENVEGEANAEDDSRETKIRQWNSLLELYKSKIFDQHISMRVEKIEEKEDEGKKRKRTRADVDKFNLTLTVVNGEGVQTDLIVFSKVTASKDSEFFQYMDGKKKKMLDFKSVLFRNMFVEKKLNGPKLSFILLQEKAEVMDIVREESDRIMDGDRLKVVPKVKKEVMTYVMGEFGTTEFNVLPIVQHDRIDQSMISKRTVISNDVHVFSNYYSTVIQPMIFNGVQSSTNQQYEGFWNLNYQNLRTYMVNVLGINQLEVDSLRLRNYPPNNAPNTITEIAILAHSANTLQRFNISIFNYVPDDYRKVRGTPTHLLMESEFRKNVTFNRRPYIQHNPELAHEMYLDFTSPISDNDGGFKFSIYVKDGHNRTTEEADNDDDDPSEWNEMLVPIYFDMAESENNMFHAHTKETRNKLGDITMVIVPMTSDNTATFENIDKMKYVQQYLETRKKQAEKTDKHEPENVIKRYDEDNPAWNVVMIEEFEMPDDILYEEEFIDDEDAAEGAEDVDWIVDDEKDETDLYVVEKEDMAAVPNQYQSSEEEEESDEEEEEEEEEAHQESMTIPDFVAEAHRLVKVYSIEVEKDYLSSNSLPYRNNYVKIMKADMVKAYGITGFESNCLLLQGIYEGVQTEFIINGLEEFIYDYKQYRDFYSLLYLMRHFDDTYLKPFELQVVQDAVNIHEAKLVLRFQNSREHLQRRFLKDAVESLDKIATFLKDNPTKTLANVKSTTREKLQRHILSILQFDLEEEYERGTLNSTYNALGLAEVSGKPTMVEFISVPENKNPVILKTREEEMFPALHEYALYLKDQRNITNPFERGDPVYLARMEQHKKMLLLFIFHVYFFFEAFEFQWKQTGERSATASKRKLHDHYFEAPDQRQRKYATVTVTSRPIQSVLKQTQQYVQGLLVQYFVNVAPNRQFSPEDVAPEIKMPRSRRIHDIPIEKYDELKFELLETQAPYTAEYRAAAAEYAAKRQQTLGLAHADLARVEFLYRVRPRKLVVEVDIRPGVYSASITIDNLLRIDNVDLFEILRTNILKYDSIQNDTTVLITEIAAGTQIIQNEMYESLLIKLHRSVGKSEESIVLLRNKKWDEVGVWTIENLITEQDVAIVPESVNLVFQEKDNEIVDVVMDEIVIPVESEDVVMEAPGTQDRRQALRDRILSTQSEEPGLRAEGKRIRVPKAKWNHQSDVDEYDIVLDAPHQLHFFLDKETSLLNVYVDDVLHVKNIEFDRIPSAELGIYEGLLTNPLAMWRVSYLAMSSKNHIEMKITSVRDEDISHYLSFFNELKGSKSKLSFIVMVTEAELKKEMENFNPVVPQNDERYKNMTEYKKLCEIFNSSFTAKTTVDHVSYDGKNPIYETQHRAFHLFVKEFNRTNLEGNIGLDEELVQKALDGRASEYQGYYAVLVYGYESSKVEEVVAVLLYKYAAPEDNSIDAVIDIGLASVMVDWSAYAYKAVYHDFEFTNIFKLLLLNLLNRNRNPIRPIRVIINKKDVDYLVKTEIFKNAGFVLRQSTTEVHAVLPVKREMSQEIVARNTKRMQAELWNEYLSRFLLDSNYMNRVLIEMNQSVLNVVGIVKIGGLKISNEERDALHNHEFNITNLFISVNAGGYTLSLNHMLNGKNTITLHSSSRSSFTVQFAAITPRSNDVLEQTVMDETTLNIVHNDGEGDCFFYAIIDSKVSFTDGHRLFDMSKVLPQDRKRAVITLRNLVASHVRSLYMMNDPTLLGQYSLILNGLYVNHFGVSSTNDEKANWDNWFNAITSSRYWADDLIRLYFTRATGVHPIFLEKPSYNPMCTFTKSEGGLPRSNLILIAYMDNNHFENIQHDGVGVFTRTSLPASIRTRYNAACGLNEDDHDRRQELADVERQVSRYKLQIQQFYRRLTNNIIYNVQLVGSTLYVDGLLRAKGLRLSDGNALTYHKYNLTSVRITHEGLKIFVELGYKMDANFIDSIRLETFDEENQVLDIDFYYHFRLTSEMEEELPSPVLIVPDLTIDSYDAQKQSIVKAAMSKLKSTSHPSYELMTSEWTKRSDDKTDEEAERGRHLAGEITFGNLDKIFKAMGLSSIRDGTNDDSIAIGDIGAGRGNVVYYAWLEYEIASYGWEIDPKFYGLYESLKDTMDGIVKPLRNRVPDDVLIKKEPQVYLEGVRDTGATNFDKCTHFYAFDSRMSPAVRLLIETSLNNQPTWEYFSSTAGDYTGLKHVDPNPITISVSMRGSGQGFTAHIYKRDLAAMRREKEEMSRKQETSPQPIDFLNSSTVVDVDMNNNNNTEAEPQTTTLLNADESKFNKIALRYTPLTDNELNALRDALSLYKIDTAAEIQARVQTVADYVNNIMKMYVEFGEPMEDQEVRMENFKEKQLQHAIKHVKDDARFAFTVKVQNAFSDMINWKIPVQNELVRDKKETDAILEKRKKSIIKYVMQHFARYVASEKFHASFKSLELVDMELPVLIELIEQMSSAVDEMNNSGAPVSLGKEWDKEYTTYTSSILPHGNWTGVDDLQKQEQKLKKKKNSTKKENVDTKEKPPIKQEAIQLTAASSRLETVRALLRKQEVDEDVPDATADADVISFDPFAEYHFITEKEYISEFEKQRIQEAVKLYGKLSDAEVIELQMHIDEIIRYVNGVIAMEKLDITHSYQNSLRTNVANMISNATYAKSQYYDYQHLQKRIHIIQQHLDAFVHVIEYILNQPPIDDAHYEFKKKHLTQLLSFLTEYKNTYPSASDVVSKLIEGVYNDPPISLPLQLLHSIHESSEAFDVRHSLITQYVFILIRQKFWKSQEKGFQFSSYDFNLQESILPSISKHVVHILLQMNYLSTIRRRTSEQIIHAFQAHMAFIEHDINDIEQKAKVEVVLWNVHDALDKAWKSKKETILHNRKITRRNKAIAKKEEEVKMRKEEFRLFFVPPHDIVSAQVQACPMWPTLVAKVSSFLKNRLSQHDDYFRKSEMFVGGTLLTSKNIYMMAPMFAAYVYNYMLEKYHANVLEIDLTLLDDNMWKHTTDVNGLHEFNDLRTNISSLFRTLLQIYDAFEGAQTTLIQVKNSYKKVIKQQVVKTVPLSRTVCNNNMTNDELIYLYTFALDTSDEHHWDAITALDNSLQQVMQENKKMLTPLLIGASTDKEKQRVFSTLSELFAEIIVYELQMMYRKAITHYQFSISDLNFATHVNPSYVLFSKRYNDMKENIRTHFITKASERQQKFNPFENIYHQVLEMVECLVTTELRLASTWQHPSMSLPQFQYHVMHDTDDDVSAYRTRMRLQLGVVTPGFENKLGVCVLISAFVSLFYLTPVRQFVLNAPDDHPSAAVREMKNLFRDIQQNLNSCNIDIVKHVAEITASCKLDITGEGNFTTRTVICLIEQIQDYTRLPIAYISHANSNRVESNVLEKALIRDNVEIERTIHQAKLVYIKMPSSEKSISRASFPFRLRMEYTFYELFAVFLDEDHTLPEKKSNHESSDLHSTVLIRGKWLRNSDDLTWVRFDNSHSDHVSNEMFTNMTNGISENLISRFYDAEKKIPYTSHAEGLLYVEKKTFDTFEWRTI
jgi:hypothetical protein